MKTYIQLLLVVLFLPVLSACDQEDDVIDIFTGKTWYMTYIAVAVLAASTNGATAASGFFGYAVA